ncbi:hypothetical protein THOG11_50291 [Vibrio harveyi]|nr:hypothetical protein TH15OA1_480238 [Vibrio harveyi]CAH1571454.1 hypothetical protein THOD03_40286 [Vibrio harveyi]CAH1581598.1 hypothetical protein THOG11_50291 [Vibrio harveyi]
MNLIVYSRGCYTEMTIFLKAEFNISTSINDFKGLHNVY